MLPILTLHSLFSLTPLAQRKKLSKKETPSDLAPAGATWGSAPSPRSLFEKSDAKTFMRGCPRGGGCGSAVKVHFIRPKCPKSRESCREIAKNADFSTFSIIKVLKSSLLFAKVVLLYKVRNFAEHLRIFSTFFVFNKIL
ncbi:MAG: hypothetical protein E7594_01930 [Ruminococcaceae bacterium]|nr:hypothetical protein [Oscillospiraceae bacterium]